MHFAQSPRRTARSAPLTCDNPDDLESVSPKFQAAVRQLERFARHDHATVLLEGESGTGKTYFARHLYRCSRRADKPFHTVSLAAIDDNLAASDLFGHIPGAFTDARQVRHGHFAAAHGGILFLDEIGKSSAGVQRKLLRALETKEITPLGSERALKVDTRIIAASNIPLQRLVDEEAFLADLHARLECFCVRIPPLRERRQDIPALVHAMVTKHARLCGYEHAPSVEPELMDILQQSDWPNNVRQLDAVVQRLLIDADCQMVLSKELCPTDLPFLHSCSERAPLTDNVVGDAVADKKGKAQAARALGVHRSTVYRHLKSRPKE